MAKLGRPPIGKVAMTNAQRVARWRLSHAVVPLPLTLTTLRLVNDKAMDALKEKLKEVVRLFDEEGVSSCSFAEARRRIANFKGAEKTLKAITIVEAERGARALLK